MQIPMQKSFLASFTYLYPISSVGTEETNVTLEKISAANKYLYVYLLNYICRWVGRYAKFLIYSNMRQVTYNNSKARADSEFGQYLYTKLNPNHLTSLRQDAWLHGLHQQNYILKIDVHSYEREGWLLIIKYKTVRCLQKPFPSRFYCTPCLFHVLSEV